MLPIRTRAWGISASNHIEFVSVSHIVGTELIGIKDHWLRHPSVTVAGSSNGLIADLDAEDRWQDPIDTVNGWLILACAALGGAQVLFARDGDHVRFAFSPGGLYKAANPLPTAFDEQVLSTEFDTAESHGDRFWSAGYSSDGQGFWFALARHGSFHRFGFLQLCDSRVASSEDADPVPTVVGFSLAGRELDAAAITEKALGLARVRDRSCRLFVGGEGYKGAGLAVSTQTNACELQGGGYLVQPLSLWSETPGAQGKVGNLIDVWAGVRALEHGNTLPEDGTRQYLAVGQLVIPWNGSEARMR